MTATPAPALPAPHAWLRDRSLPAKAAAVAFGAAVLTASSHVSVPMVPVPMTMQTLAVTLAGALYGWRLGGLTILFWLALGAFGLPVFSGGTGGIERFFGPTGGYLVAFPVAGAVTGWLVGRGWDGRRAGLAFAAMLAGNALCLAIGGGWLAAMIGAQKALAAGVLPFLPGAALKAALGAALLKALALYGRARP